MNETEVFILADRALESVVAQIRDDQWSMSMPENFQTRASNTTPTLREIINYHAYDDSWVPDMLEGLTMDKTGREKFDGDLLGDDPIGNFSAIVDRACAAASSFTDIERVVHCSFGDFSARDYLLQINSFRALRDNDIVVAIGIDPTLSAELVQGIWDEVSPVADEWRTYGVFGPALEVSPDASLQDRLLGPTGRRPTSSTPGKPDS